MHSRARRIIKWTLALLLAGAVAFAAYVYWSFCDNRMPNNGIFPLEITSLRDEAAKLTGPKAERIEVETVSHTPTPKMAMVAGTSWDTVDMIRSSYRVVFPDQTLLIDTGNRREDALQNGAIEYDDTAWAHVLQATAEASTIILTHGHGDHAGGLLASADVEGVLAAAKLSEAQIKTMRSGGLAAEAFAPSLFNTGLLAIAPGVVLIPAAGHTPGSQMIYVQMASGQEFIFMGDTASLADNVRLGRIRSHYVTDKIGNDDRRAVFLQTAALQKLSQDAPDVALVPGHDAIATSELEKQGLLSRGFTFSDP